MNREESVPSGGLEAWLDGLYGETLVLTDVGLADERVVLDHSPASLRALEEVLLRRPSIARGVSVYFGECLLRAGYGRWDWAEDGPMVRPGPEVDVEPVAVTEAVGRALKRGDGRALAPILDTWLEAAARSGRGPEGTALTLWLEHRERLFPEWAREFPGPWDFTPASLDALEELARRVTPDAAALAKNTGFGDGAAWYLGEVLRRSAGGGWNAPEDAPFDEDRYIEHIGPRDHTAWPATALEIALTEPGHLRRLHDGVTAA